MTYTTALEGIMKLEVGAEYKDIKGRKCKCVEDDGTHPLEAYKVMREGVEGHIWHYQDGRSNCFNSEYDLIAPWPTDDAPTGPVRTVTRTTREIVPGEYGDVQVTGSGNIVVVVKPDADAIRAAIATLTEIAQALEDS